MQQSTTFSYVDVLYIQWNLSIEQTIRTQLAVLIGGCPKFRGRFVHNSMWSGLQRVSSSEICPLFRVSFIELEVPLYTTLLYIMHKLT